MLIRIVGVVARNVIIHPNYIWYASLVQTTSVFALTLVILSAVSPVLASDAKTCAKLAELDLAKTFGIDVSDLATTLVSKSGKIYSGTYVTETETKIILADESSGQILAIEKDKLDLGKSRLPAHRAEILATSSLPQPKTTSPEAVFSKSPSVKYGGDDFATNIRQINGRNRNIVHAYSDFEIAVSQGRIFQNVPVTSLEEGSYAYVITKDGKIVFGRVDDVTEFGVKHFQLARGESVVAAGEVRVSANGKIDFNVDSGSFTPKLINEAGITREQLAEKVKEYFKGQGATTNYASRAEQGLLVPTGPPTREALEYYCRSKIFASFLPDLCHDRQ